MSGLIQRSTMLILFALTLCTGLQAREKSIIKIGNSVVVEAGKTVKSAVAIGGDVRIYGTVEEDAVAVGGSVYVGPDAVIRKNAVSVGGSVSMEQGGVIYGDVVEVGGFRLGSLFMPFQQYGYWGFPWGFHLISFFGLLALALLSVLLLPNQLDSVSKTIKTDIPKAILYGVLAGILFVPLIIMLAVSILGIPLIPFTIMITVLMALFGYFAVAMVLGSRLLTTANRPEPSALLNVFLGLVIIWVIGLIPILGHLIKIAVYVIGLGGVLIAIVDWRKLSKARIVIEEPKTEKTAGE
ncbi:MAG: hypothetical protein GXO92_05170 [FCB group bacterium]|nr:hypothetical protein [FCB group bacterium]